MTVKAFRTEDKSNF
uniref:Uncharacterized protein n=1 Tax=Anguilla anguilla TaxID=7936 RepID=A0A0E9XEM4_ANGAN